MKKLNKKAKKIISIIAAAVALFSVGLIVYAVVTDSDDDSAVNTFVPAEVDIAVQENVDANSDETPEFENEIAWTPEGNTYKAIKQVTVKNSDGKENSVSVKNTTDAYIRVMLVPRWTVQVTTAQGTDTAEYSGYSLGKMPTNDSIKGNSYTYSVVVIDSSTGNSGSDNSGSDSGSGSSSTGSTIDRTVTFTLVSGWYNNWFYKDGYFYCKTKVAPGEETPQLLESVSVAKAFYEEFANTNGCEFQVDVLADSIQADGGAAEVRWDGITVNQDGELTIEQATEQVTK